MKKILTVENCNATKNDVKRVTLKSLHLALVVGVMLIGAQANGATLNDVDLSLKPKNMPTLDYLHKNNVMIPQKNSVPILSPNSGYRLKKVDAKADGSKPDGDNIITKFEVVNVTKYYDKITGELVKTPLEGVDYKVVQTKEFTPVYYSVDLKQTIYGHQDAVNKEVKYYSWSGKSDAPLTEGTSDKYDIIYNVDKDRVSSGRIDTNQNGANINKDFIDNSANYPGGAIDNENGTIGDITGDFIGNSASAGGAIYNGYDSNIDNIVGDFINNNATIGGAIDNANGTIGNITGNFIGNRANEDGGAISNRDCSQVPTSLADSDDSLEATNNNAYSTVIGNITGNFIGNSANNAGGAICNEMGSIDNITGDFVGNSANGVGGAIANGGSAIGSITGDFIRNSADYAGGAIYNDYGTIGNITGDFIGNSSGSLGGAIYNIDGSQVAVGSLTPLDDSLEVMNNNAFNTVIGNITGNFIGNEARSGGAIYNRYGAIGNITGDFVGNTALGFFGGAIYNDNDSAIGNITGDFVGNHTRCQGGAIFNSYDAIIGDIAGDFIGNSTSNGEAYNVGGGAILNAGTIGDITGSFIKNYSNYFGGDAFGGAIANVGLGSIGDITADFINNNATTAGGAIYNNNIVYNHGPVRGTGIFIGNITGDFIGNSAGQAGGAIYNAISEPGPKIADEDLDDSNADSENLNTLANRSNIGYISGNFIGNHAGEIGGAIYSNSDINILADGKTSVYQGNYTEKNGVKDDNAIYMDNQATLNFNMKNNGKVYMADNIDGASGYNVNIKGDDINNTTFYMLNDIRNANVTFDNTTINTINNQVHVYNFNSLAVASDTNFVADVDLANAQMDRITANSYGAHQGNLNVVGMNLLSDAKDPITEIYFAEQGLKDNVINGVSKAGEYNLPNGAQTTFYTPIYKYSATYDNRNDGGYFVFDRISAGNSSGNPSDNYNPAVLSPSVASQSGAYSTMNQTFNYAFQNSDNFMAIPYLERVAMRSANMYAMTPTGDATDVGTFSPLFDAKNETYSAWVKPYVSFENIPLKNGPKVSNISYGSLIGLDTPLKSVSRGWDRTWTGYIGYNGASQSFSGVDATQNGGLLGGTLTMYRGNFFNATTLSTGAIVGDNRTMYGTDNYTMLMAGIGNKTGYNIEFKDGLFIVQPNLLLSYTFVNTFDYTNAAGVRMKSDPLHAIQVAPGVKLIANTKNGWQPYIGVNMIWNILDKSRVTANDVRLPEMSIKPYVQYGLGVQKRFKDSFMAFGQAMIQNGGRNGIALSVGFRWAIGK
ncbi:hypothetical protein EGQ24_07415 [bacterium]|nr:hypothetical protein [bacterium]